MKIKKSWVLVLGLDNKSCINSGKKSAKLFNHRHNFRQGNQETNNANNLLVLIVLDFLFSDFS